MNIISAERILMESNLASRRFFWRGKARENKVILCEHKVVPKCENIHLLWEREKCAWMWKQAKINCTSKNPLHQKWMQSIFLRWKMNFDEFWLKFKKNNIRKIICKIKIDFTGAKKMILSLINDEFMWEIKAFFQNHSYTNS